MMFRRSLIALFAVATLPLVGCGGGGGNDTGTMDMIVTDTPVLPDTPRPDTPVQPDTPPPDGSQPDGSQPDGSQPDGSQPDGSQPDANPGQGVCAAANIIDLDEGTISDNRLTFLGDSTNAAVGQELTPPAKCTSAKVAGRQVALTYTVQTGGFLEVSTANPGTEIDTVVWLLDGCTGSAAALGCNDDVSVFGGIFTSRVLSDARVEAGTTVTIIVAVYSDPMKPADGGAFELTVRELEPVADGQPCVFADDICNPGQSFCIPTLTSTSQDHEAGVCRAHGSAGGACDDDLPCTDNTLTCSDIGLCQAEVDVGDACDFTGFGADVCPAGSTCVPNGTTFACRADGTAAGTPCRDTEPRCDGALACSTESGAGICQTQATTDCVPLAGGTRCTTAGQVCAASAYGVGTCRTPVAESNMDHDTFATAQAITAPTAVMGTVSDEADCYAVTVTEGQSIFAEISDGQGGCPDPIDTVMFLVDSQENTVAANDDSLVSFCSIIDGTKPTSGANNLPAGTYAICVTPYEAGDPFNYVLSVNVQ